MARHPLPLLICFDVEPDPRVLDEPNDWVGFEHLFRFIQEARPSLAEATGADPHFIWSLRMDPQIERTYGTPTWVAQRYPDELAALEEAGDEIALHIHPWRWDESTGWVSDFVDTEWSRVCVEMAFQAYAEAFGRDCRTTAFGDRWLTRDNLAVAVAHGARYDLTPEPGHRPTPTPNPQLGILPDYTDTPRKPYRPSPDDPTRPGGSNDAPWIIPITTHPREGLGQRYSHLAHRTATAPPRGNGPFRGWVDVVDDTMIAGWARDEATPDDRVEVALYDGTHCVAVVTADQHRGDLEEAGIGDGRHGFSVPTGRRLRDGRPHRIRAVIVGTRYELGDAPKTVKLPVAPEPDDWLPLNLYYDSATICQSLDAWAASDDLSHISLKARCDVMVSEDERPQFLATFDYLPRFASQHNVRLVTPEEALSLLPARLPQALRRA
jgi:hypothetical protein